MITLSGPRAINSPKEANMVFAGTEHTHIETVLRKIFQDAGDLAVLVKEQGVSAALRFEEGDSQGYVDARRRLVRVAYELMASLQDINSVFTLTRPTDNEIHDAMRLGERPPEENLPAYLNDCVRAWRMIEEAARTAADVVEMDPNCVYIATNN